MKKSIVSSVSLLLILGSAAARCVVNRASGGNVLEIRQTTDLKIDHELPTIALSGDGRTLGVATSDSPDAESVKRPAQLSLWNIATRKAIHKWQTNGFVGKLAFSADSTMLASGGYSVQIWSASDGKIFRTIDAPKMVDSVAFSPDGKTLSIVDADEILSQWDVQTGAKLRSWSIGSGYISSIAYLPNGNAIATGGPSDGSIKLWDARTGSLLETLWDHSNAVDSIAISGDGSMLAAGSWDHSGSVWDLKTRALLFRLDGHSFNVWSVWFSPEGKRLASASTSEIKVWDTSTHKLLATIPSHGMSVLFGRDGKTLLSDYGKFIKIMHIE